MNGCEYSAYCASPATIHRQRRPADLGRRLRAQEVTVRAPSVPAWRIRGTVAFSAEQFALRLVAPRFFGLAPSSICFWTNGVNTQPGQIALQVTSVVAFSSATTLVSPHDAVLGGDVGRLFGRATRSVSRSDVDDTAPVRALSSWESPFVAWKEAPRLIAITASQRSRGIANWSPCRTGFLGVVHENIDPAEIVRRLARSSPRSGPASTCRRRCTTPAPRTCR